jgi:hypothetical protein
MYRPVLAAFFARTNMGLEPPSVDDVKQLVGSKPNLADAVLSLCEQFIETDEQVEMFNGEGKMWLKKLSDMSDEAIRSRWSHYAPQFDAAVIDV